MLSPFLQKGNIFVMGYWEIFVMGIENCWSYKRISKKQLPENEFGTMNNVIFAIGCQVLVLMYFE